jgi:hypothetical protein
MVFTILDFLFVEKVKKKLLLVSLKSLTNLTILLVTLFRKLVPPVTLKVALKAACSKSWL